MHGMFVFLRTLQTVDVIIIYQLLTFVTFVPESDLQFTK